MRAAAVAALLMALPVGAARAEPSGVVVRSRIDPAEGAVIGQPVRLIVEVLFADAMPRPPRVTPPSVAGAQIFRFETQGLTIRDRIGARDYVGQRFEFTLFARRPGAFALPGAQVTLLDPAGDVVGAATAEPLRMVASAPPGLDASGPVIASTSVSARQSWAPDPAAPLTPGDALVRTIVREAAGVPALAMAELAVQAPAGVRAYADPPASDDRVDRGALTGRRTDTVTYLFERPGAYALPELVQPWWDLSGAEAQAERLPGVQVMVAGAQSEGIGKIRWPGLLLLAVAASIALPLVALVAARLHRARRAWRIRESRSEAAARRALCVAAGSGDAARTFQAAQVWRRCLAPAERTRLEADAAFGASLAALERALFGRGPAWTRDEAATLARLAEAVRLGPPRRRSGPRRPGRLPPLNPAVAG